jgi:hypothetical protein
MNELLTALNGPIRTSNAPVINPMNVQMLLSLTKHLLATANIDYGGDYASTIDPLLSILKSLGRKSICQYQFKR